MTIVITTWSPMKKQFPLQMRQFWHGVDNKTLFIMYYLSHLFSVFLVSVPSYVAALAQRPIPLQLYRRRTKQWLERYCMNTCLCVLHQTSHLSFQSKEFDSSPHPSMFSNQVFWKKSRAEIRVQYLQITSPLFRLLFLPCVTIALVFVS